MRTYSYESILRAVGRVLDEADAEGFTIRDTQDGLVVETQSRALGREDVPLHLGLRDLVELIDWTSAESEREAPRYELSYAHDEGTLRTILRSRELVGAGR